MLVEIDELQPPNINEPPVGTTSLELEVRRLIIIPRIAAEGNGQHVPGKDGWDHALQQKLVDVGRHALASQGIDFEEFRTEYFAAKELRDADPEMES